ARRIVDVRARKTLVLDQAGVAGQGGNTTLPHPTLGLPGYLRAHGNATTSWESLVYGAALLGNVCTSVDSFNPSPISPQGIGATINLSATATCVGSTVPEF